MSLIKILLSESINTNDVSYEKEEIDRTVNELNIDIPPEDLMDRFQRAPIFSLSMAIWSRLKNTDSFSVKSKERLKSILAKYGRDTEVYDKIKREILTFNSHPPLILSLGNGDYYLVAGNTRLMVSKIMGITPKVKIVKV